jgi:outer membrane lipoprotein carrier protein
MTAFLFFRSTKYICGVALVASLSTPPCLANERLDAVLSAMKAAGDELKTLQAKFDQNSHDFILEMDEKTTGELFVEIPGKIRWEYGLPSPKVLLVSGDKIRLYNPTANQVQEFKKGQMKGVGADLLIGFGKSNAEIAKNYDVSLVEENETTAMLKLVPKPDSKASIFRAIELTMDKQKWVPLRSVFHEANKDTTEILFKDIVINAKLPAKTFKLDLPPGVEIVKN